MLGEETFLIHLPDACCLNATDSIEDGFRQSKDLELCVFDWDPVEREVCFVVKRKKQVLNDGRLKNTATTVKEDVDRILQDQYGENYIHLRKTDSTRSLSSWVLGFIGTGAGVCLLLLSSMTILPLAAVVLLGIVSVLLTLALGRDSFSRAIRNFKKYECALAKIKTKLNQESLNDLTVLKKLFKNKTGIISDGEATLYYVDFKDKSNDPKITKIISQAELTEKLDEALKKVAVSSTLMQNSSNRMQKLEELEEARSSLATLQAKRDLNKLFASMKFDSCRVANSDETILVTKATKRFFKQRKFTMDTLFTVSAFFIILVSAAAFFLPSLPMIFESGLFIFGFHQIGLGIEQSIKRNLAAKNRFQDALPNEVVLASGDKEILSKVAPGDILILEAGSLIPVDGTYIEEDLNSIHHVYDTIKSGKTMPHVMQTNEVLLSGMKLAQKQLPIHMKVTADVADSYLACLDKRLKTIQQGKIPIEKDTDKILQYFIPVVFSSSLFVGLVIGLFFPLALAIQAAIAVLVSACPCALGIIIPLAKRVATKQINDIGFHIDKEDAVESAAKVNKVVFDLNGTLTTGRYEVDAVVCMDSSFDEARLCQYMFALEQESSHPIAEAILGHSKKMAGNKQILQSSYISKERCGVKGAINNTWFTVGNRQMMKSAGIKLPDSDPDCEVIYIASEKKVLGYFCLRSPLRNDAIKVVKKLHNLNKEVHICTGASLKTAQYYARQLGVPDKNIAADCCPKSKLAYIEKLKNAKKAVVAMIGDAGNDHLAFQESALSIVINSELTATYQTNAAVIIDGDGLLSIAHGFFLAKKTMVHIRQNLYFSLVYNVFSVLFMGGGLLLTAGFALNPAFGVILMSLQMMLLLANTARFKTANKTYLQSEGYTDEASGKSFESAQSYRKITNVIGARQAEVNSPSLPLSEPKSVINFRKPPLRPSSQIPVDPSIVGMLVQKT